MKVFFLLILNDNTYHIESIDIWGSRGWGKPLVGGVRSWLVAACGCGSVNEEDFSRLECKQNYLAFVCNSMAGPDIKQ